MNKIRVNVSYGMSNWRDNFHF